MKLTFKQFLESKSAEKNTQNKTKQLTKKVDIKRDKYDVDHSRPEVVDRVKNILSKEMTFEAQVELQPVEDVWGENESDIVSYESSILYLAKDNEKTKKMDVYIVEPNGKRKFQDDYTKTELDQIFRPVSSTSKEDAEGFREYYSQETIDAVKWTKDPTDLDLGDGLTLRIKKGDYLTRSVDGRDYVFAVEPRGQFESVPRRKI
jgi:hypothetical protein